MKNNKEDFLEWLKMNRDINTYLIPATDIACDDCEDSGVVEEWTAPDDMRMVTCHCELSRAHDYVEQYN